MMSEGPNRAERRMMFKKVQRRPVKLNEAQRAQALAQLGNIQIAQQAFQSYVQGIMLGMGLEGNWNFNPATGVFSPIDAPQASVPVIPVEATKPVKDKV